MPSHAEQIASLNTTIETFDGRIISVETNMAQLLGTMERLAKSMEALQTSVDKIQTQVDRRPDKQPAHQTLPPLLATPTGHSILDDPTSPTILPGQHSNDQHPPATNPRPDYDHHPRTPRLDVPTFTGEGVEGWLFQLQRFFELNNTSTEQMLVVAPLFMTGEPLRWYQWKHITGQIHSWDQLARDLRRRFGPSDYYDAEVALNKLVQTSSVACYITAFESLSTRTPGLTAHNLLCRFLAGLREDVHRELVLLRPQILEEAMSIARVAEEKLLALRTGWPPPYVPRLLPSTPFSNNPRSDKPKPPLSNLPTIEPLDQGEPETTPDPPCITFHALQGRPSPFPAEILDSRRVHTKQGAEDQVLVRWTGQPLEDASWETVSSIRTDFPSFDLEDKVCLGHGGNVARVTRKEGTMEAGKDIMHGKAGTDGTTTAATGGVRRSNRALHKSGRYSQTEYAA